MAPRVKICGLTRIIDLAAAREADYVGLVVESPASRRNLSHETAASLASLAAPAQRVVAVTASTDAHALDRALETIAPDVLQLPGRASPATLRLLRASHPDVALWLACRPEAVPADLSLAQAVVLDALTGDGYGGSGHPLPWREVAPRLAALPCPAVLAGGLTPQNVGEAIAATRPFAVDVSSGVETEGLKDPQKIHAFIHNARVAGGVPP